MHRLIPALVLTTLVVAPAHARKRRPPTPSPDEVAAELLGRSLASDEAYEELRVLCDTIGHRISGSPQLDRAIAWGADAMKADGLDVSLEPVQVPRWVRGPATLQQLAPVVDTLDVIALGTSVSTPEGGVEADVLVVSSFDELEARADEADGRIVVFDVPFTTYGETVRYRYGGASAASRHGAVAALVRSVGPSSLYTAHTGQQAYADDVEPIAVGAIPIEDATRLHRQQEAGLTPRLRLQLQATMEGDAPSHNVIGELKGRERPDEIVVLGCHLDSWDVGQGAQDDGAGCVTIMEAAAQLAALPQPPRRTLRVVLYTNEENGLAGGKAYAEAHSGEAIVAAVEDDTGSGAPLGFRVDARGPDGGRDAGAAAAVIDRLQPYLPWMAPVGADHASAGYSGADVSPLVGATGAVGFGLSHDMTGYWPIHHTEADTFDKVDPQLVKRNVAAMTLFAWALTEAEVDWPAVAASGATRPSDEPATD